jgi:hypothetical protein
VTVVYRPTSLETPPLARLVFKNNVRGKEEQSVKLSVLGSDPRIATTDGETVVSFAGAMGSQETTIGIRNVGTGTLVVSDIQLQLQTEPARDNAGQPVDEFVIEPLAPLSWNIDEASVDEVRVTYHPVDNNTDKALLKFISNDTSNPNFAITLTSAEVHSELSVTPNPVLFGDVSSGNAVRKQVRFDNLGLKLLNVLDLSIRQGGAQEEYKLDDNQPRSFQLRPGMPKDIDVIYEPHSADGSDATLVIQTDADNVPRTGGGGTGTVEIQLRRSLEGIGPLVNVDPPRVDMTAVAPGASDTGTVTITNGGDAPLNITAIRLSADGDAEGASDPEFTLTDGGGAVTLAPEDTHDVTVTFARPADDRSAHLASLIIESNAPSSPDVVRFVADVPMP